MQIFAVLFVLVSHRVEGLTLNELEQKLEQKNLQHEKELARINAIISALQVKSVFECIT